MDDVSDVIGPSCGLSCLHSYLSAEISVWRRCSQRSAVVQRSAALLENVGIAAQGRAAQRSSVLK